MSLVISTELADTSYRNAKLYTLKGTDVTPDLSSHNFATDKHRNMYMTDSYSSESYEKYFRDSPTEELIEPSSSSISGNSVHPDGSASSYILRASSGASVVANNPFDTSILSTRRRDVYQSNFGSDFVENESPDCLEFDGEMRLKLQELERALLSDEEEEEEDLFETVQSMEIDPDMAEWANPLQDMLLHDSPKESISSDSSNLSSISSTTKETSQNSSRNPKQLLYDCARVLSEGNVEEATSMINHLRQMVSIQGDPSQRIAAYMVEGLAARLASSGKCIYQALRCKEPPSSDRLAAMQILSVHVLNLDLSLQMAR